MPPVSGVLGRVSELLREAAADRGGALWRLDAEGRQLDSNVIRLLAGAGVDVHVEPDLDVVLFVAEGGGWLETADGRQELTPGCVVWLPRGSRRALSAGPDGLAYLTVHRRRPGLAIRAAAPQGGEPACLLHRVCAECGRLAQESDARYCARCGAGLPSD
ncbi:cupin domain-containing protein [Streptomyces sparsogenes]|uniref:cupin domain-containing protein n=1 Tax=Streptomyces sparsogenes TaxID=67365 RepID=UPI0033D10DE1